jgi:hypothetical protein
MLSVRVFGRYRSTIRVEIALTIVVTSDTKFYVSVLGMRTSSPALPKKLARPLYSIQNPSRIPDCNQESY